MARSVGATLVVVALVAAWAALAVHSASVVESADVRESRRLQDPDRLRTLANQALRHAAESLADRSLPAADRLSRSRESLEGAERLLALAVLHRPTDPRLLTRLIAVRWELDPPTTPSSLASTMETVRAASALAPRSASAQQTIAELLLRAGRRDEALTYARRASDLSTGHRRELVGLLVEHALSADEIVAALSPHPSVVEAVRESLFPMPTDAGAYLSFLERAFGDPIAIPAEILPGYADAALRLGRYDDVRRLLESRQSRSGSLDERASDLYVRALIGSGRYDQAVAEARGAVARYPDSSSAVATLGDAALAASRFDLAIDAYRDGLLIIARGTGSAAGRTRLYRSIGRAEEGAGRYERARSAYRLAVEIGNDSFSRQRLEALGGSTSGDGSVVR